MTPSEKQFNFTLRRIVLPALSAAGFVHDDQDDLPDTIFRKPVSRDDFDGTQIIEFQIGTESLHGRFTVNLGVFNRHFAHADMEVDRLGSPEIFDCLLDMTKRLGFLFDPPRSRLARLFCRKRREPHDYWWELSDRPSAMEETLGQVVDCIVHKGIPWLDGMSERDRFVWATRQLQERQERLDSRLTSRQARKSPASPDGGAVIK